MAPFEACSSSKRKPYVHIEIQNSCRNLCCINRIACPWRLQQKSRRHQRGACTCTNDQPCAYHRTFRRHDRPKQRHEHPCTIHGQQRSNGRNWFRQLDHVTNRVAAGLPCKRAKQQVSCCELGSRSSPAPLAGLGRCTSRSSSRRTGLSCPSLLSAWPTCLELRLRRYRTGVPRSLDLGL